MEFFFCQRKNANDKDLLPEIPTGNVLVNRKNIIANVYHFFAKESGNL
jgi:hypothetical protein